MMDTVLQHFYDYMGKIAEAEQRGDYKTIFETIRKAEELPEVSGFQGWLLEYHKTATMLRYGAESLQRREKLGARLLELRDRARLMPEGDFDWVKAEYLSLLALVLRKNFDNMETFPRYEELALEMLELVERGEYRQGGTEDHDLLPYAVLGEYYTRKGRFSDGAQYYTYIREAVQSREWLSVPALFFAVCYIEWLCGNGDLPQMQKTVEELRDMLASGRVHTEEGQRDSLCISTQSFFGKLSALLELAGRKEYALQLMQELMAGELLSVDAKRDGMPAVACCYLAVLHGQKKKCGVLEQMKIKVLLSECEKRKDFSRLAPWIRSDFYRAYFNLNYMKSPQKAKSYLDRAVQILSEDGFLEQDRLLYLNQMLCAVREYQAYGETHRACECLDALFHRMAQFYSLAGNYDGNERLDRHLAICGLEFHAAYHAARELAEPRMCMEYSLNFKKVLRSAIRLRDRAAKEKRMVHRTDALEFTYYGLQQLIDQIPEDTAVVDFVSVEPERGQHRSDVSVIAKGNGEIRFAHYEMAGDRGWKLIQGSLQDVIHLWVCPDGDVRDLPWELAAGARMDGKNQDVVYWQSLRDIFEERDKEEEKLGGNYEIPTIKG